jgi:uncharacterized protein YabN with tetrapyrrole methylase and pyrophosphatase domain
VSARKGQKPVDIYVVGLGIMTVYHITREAEAVMKACNHIFYVDISFGIEEYLQGQGIASTSLMPEYKAGVDRRRTYEAMATRIIDAALEDPPVCFATYGHPHMFVYPTQLIKRAAALLDLSVRIVPGISALDTVLTDVGLDPGGQGLQMYEATDLLARERPLQKDVPCVLWQVGTVGTALYTEQRGNAERFGRLERYLLQFYPPDHLVTMIFSSTYPLVEPFRETFPLCEFSDHLATGLQSGMLYIPPTQQRAIHNQAILREVYDKDYLIKITESSWQRRDQHGSRWCD